LSHILIIEMLLTLPMILMLAVLSAGGSEGVLWTGPLKGLLPASRTVVVLHSLQVEECARMLSMLQYHGIQLCSVSLRHTGAMDALSALVALAERSSSADTPVLYVGASSVVDDRQVEAALAAGAAFLSSTLATPSVIHKAAALHLPFIPGVRDVQEAHAALAVQAKANARTDQALRSLPRVQIPRGIKVYPAQSPSHVAAVRRAVGEGVDIMAAGGLIGADMAAYVDAGASGFACGVVCSPGSNEKAHRKLRGVAQAQEVLVARGTHGPRCSSTPPQHMQDRGIGG
jgi:2-keto-3-deoxy-6-phosphogluconate aldolase